MRAEGSTAGKDARRVPLARGLSAKLLLLTIVFVMIAEVLIFLPSLAGYRLRWLEERLSNAATVGIVLMEMEGGSLSRQAQDDVLAGLGVMAIAVRDEGTSRMLVVSQVPPQVDAHVDLAATGLLRELVESVDTAIFGGDRVLRVFGTVGQSDKEFEIVVADAELRGALLVHAREMAILSLVISLITAALVYYAIDRIMIRPIRTMTRSMLAFAARPDDASLVIVPEPRQDEIGVAERELAGMQTELQRTLSEQRRLADLGLAVSKINHDMRNMLAAAQLMSDRLSRAKDPTVQAFLPKLVRTLDRAVSYSTGVLAYGRTQEPPPARRRVGLHAMIEELRHLLGLDEANARVDFVNAVPVEMQIDADPDQLFRVMSNLGRNAIEAMKDDQGEAIVRRLSIGARREGSVAVIEVEDTGPGLPRRARENLFAAFRGSARSGGTGLGLAIASELVRAHGGEIELVESRSGRTLFRLTIPDQPISIDDARGPMRRRA